MAIQSLGSAGVIDANVNYGSLPGGERKYAVIGMSVVFGVLAILAVILRFVSRHMRKARITWDDYSVILALIFTLGVCIDSIVLATVGDVGAREFTLDGKLKLPMDIFTTLRYRRQIGVWILSWMSVLAHGFVKITVILLYRRIFDVQVGRAFTIFRTMLWIMLVISIMWTIAFFFGCLFICNPIEAFFLNEIPKCIKFEVLWRGLAVSDTVIDALILLLPLQPMRHLQLPLRRKLGILAIFSTGLVVIIAGIVRIAIFYNVLDTVSKDAAYHNQPATLWAMIEATLGVVGACLPCLAPLFGTRSVKSMVDSIRSKISTSSLQQRDSDSERRAANNAQQHDGGWSSSDEAHTREGTVKGGRHSSVGADEEKPPLSA